MDSSLAEQATAVNLLAASCLTCIVYNHVITFDLEISRMWSKRLSLANVLFFVNRYLVEAMIIFNCIAASQKHLTNGFCSFYLRWLDVTLALSHGAVQGILVLRIYALHRKNKLAYYTAFFFYFGGSATQIGVVIKDCLAEVQINPDLQNLPGCYPTTVSSIVDGFWIVPFIVESVLFLLVVSKVLFWWRNGSPIPKILTILARDSTIYFAVIMAFLVANFTLFQVGSPLMSKLFVIPCMTAGCVLGSHMLLNIKGLMDPEDEDFLGGSRPTNLPLHAKKPTEVSITISRDLTGYTGSAVH